MRSIKTHLTVTLLLCILLPGGLIGTTAYGLAFKTIRENRIEDVGQIADARYEAMRMRLLDYNERSKSLLDSLITVCRYSGLAINACAQAKMEQFAVSNHTVGLSFHSGTDSDLVMGSEAISLDQLKKPFLPGQIAATSISKLDGASLLSLLSVDPASGFSLVATYPGHKLQDIFVSSPALGQSGEAFLADNQGLFITKLRYTPQQEAAKPISTVSMQRCLRKENSETLDFDYRNIPGIHGFRFVPEIGGGCIMVHIDQAEAFMPLTRWTVELGALIVFFACCAGLIATMISRSMTKPIIALADMADAFARGDFTQRACSASYQEITELSPLFNYMAGQLDDNISWLKTSEHGLKKKVVERAIELREQHKKYPSVIQNTTEGFWHADREGRLLEVNPAYACCSGYSQAELVAMRINDLDSQETPEETAEHIRKVIQNGMDVFETRHRRKDGSMWDVEVHAFFIEENGGYFVGFFRDISERKRLEQLLELNHITELNQMAQEIQTATYKLQDKQIELEMQNEALRSSNRALTESHDRYVDLFDFAPIGYLTLTDKGIITEINLTGAALLGVERKNALQRYIGSFLAPEECDRWHQHNLRTLQHNDKQSCEFAIKRQDGTVFYALLDCQRRDASTSPMVRVSFTDITDRKQLERQLQRAQKMEALGQLTGGVAHEFNNILAAILGYSNLALERCIPEPSGKLARYMGEVISASERARDLITALLAFSRTSSAVASMPLAMAPEVEKAVAILPFAIPAGIEVITHIEPDVPPVRIDPIEVQQVLINLSVNARDAIGEEGHIDITLERAKISNKICAICNTVIDGDYVALEVKDSGNGIPANIQQRIFDPFFTTKEIDKGSGLGLSMVQGIVIKNNAHLLIESSSEHGTSFRLLFPAAEEAIPAPSVVTPIAPMPMTKHWRIWVVEDHASLAAYYQKLLQKQGYLVTVFTDPAKALYAFQLDSDGLDLLLTDQTLPYLTGVELAGAVLAIKPELPVILVTGCSEIINADEVKRLGIRCYLNKPVDGKKLLDILAVELCRNDFA
ncbi:MAG: PAS domain S-box protein [Methylococcaceae bacterium]